MNDTKEKTFDVTKEYKNLYAVKAGEPEIVTVPSLPYFMIDGEGDPNTSAQFKAAVQALYGLSYTIKMMPKKGIIPHGYVPYKVSLLQGLWRIKEGTEFSADRKDDWEWTLMIMQPPFVTQSLLEQAQEMAKTKKNPSTDLVRLVNYDEGLCVQMLHTGPYRTEPDTFKIMEALAESQGYVRNHGHHEIYISDPGRTDSANLRTILRFQISKAAA